MGAQSAAPRGNAFGTFQGVYTPSILTILGVVMYLRFGWVLGHVGLPATLLIVTLATSITFLTGLSIAAIATNMRIGGGGAYYMISRSLGIETGAAVGLPLFLAQALGISFYIAGFTESVCAVFPALAPKAVAVTTLLALTALAWKSADLTLRTQYAVLAVIAGSLLSFFLGRGPGMAVAAAETALPVSPGFWAVFAVFFPAVTGIEAGIALSGDLRDPARSLPRGTLAAIITGFLVYLAVPVWLSHTVHEQALLFDPLVMAKVAVFGNLVIAGVWCASLSSAVGSLLGAPRTLQALARDGIIPRVLGRGAGPNDEPRFATGVAFAVALSGILLGDLNLIAPVLAMFFLTSYGLINASAAFEGLIASPSWRPQFRLHWLFSAAGAAGCLAAMLMIDAGATFVALAVTVTVYVLVQRRQLRAGWGDLRSGILALVARYAVYKLAEKEEDRTRTWRPNLLVFSGAPTARWYLVELADAITHGKGFTTIVVLLPEATAPERSTAVQESVHEYLRRHNVPALVRAVPAANVYDGAADIIRHYGIGTLVPNTVMLGDTAQRGNFTAMADLVRLCHRGGRNLVIVQESDPTPAYRAPRIVVWWGRQKRNAGLLLTLAWLLKTSPEWAGAELELRTVVGTAEDADAAQQRLREMTNLARLDARIGVEQQGTESVFAVIRRASAGAGMIFLGLREPQAEESGEDYARYYAGVLQQTRDFPPLALVLAAENVDFHRLFR